MEAPLPFMEEGTIEKQQRELMALWALEDLGKAEEPAIIRARRRLERRLGLDGDPCPDLPRRVAYLRRVK